MKSRSDAILRLIAVIKLVKGVALVAVAFGVLSHRWLGHLQPSNRLMRTAIARVASLDPHTAALVAVATLVYAAVFATEGVGLLFKKVWAEYVTTGVTISFIPIELYELLRHGSVVKAAVIAVNLAIVVYLVWRLRRDRHWPFRNDRSPH